MMWEDKCYKARAGGGTQFRGILECFQWQSEVSTEAERINRTWAGER